MPTKPALDYGLSIIQSDTIDSFYRYELHEHTLSTGPVPVGIPIKSRPCTQPRLPGRDRHRALKMRQLLASLVIPTLVFLLQIVGAIPNPNPNLDPLKGMQRLLSNKRTEICQECLDLCKNPRRRIIVLGETQVTQHLWALLVRPSLLISLHGSSFPGSLSALSRPFLVLPFPSSS